MTVDDFISRWKSSGASERGNYQLFLSELCDLLDISHPDPAGSDTRTNEYAFARLDSGPALAFRVEAGTAVSISATPLSQASQ